MFTKAYVLSPTDFRLFISDLVEEWREYRIDEPDADLNEWLESEFEFLLDDGGVDMLMIYDDKAKEWEEINSGEDFVSFIENRGDLKLFTKVGESRRIKRRTMRFRRR